MKSNSESSASFGDNTFFIAMTVIILFVGLVAGFLYWRYTPAKVDYAIVYEQLGISPLPSSIETLAQIQKRFDQLRREPCYRDAIADLSESLIKVGYPREAATSLRSFVKRCKNSEWA